ncbi:MAG: alpha/beta hydrolase, partial [Acidobacteria bacterium]|nr:alpha/beta hydrolase [Acidobacteriota bacterium]
MLVALLASIVALMSAQPTGAPSSDVRVSTAQVGSQRVRYIDWGGSGEPFVLLPARCDSPFVYGDLAPFLTKHLRVLSPWTRGCPGAEPSSGEMGIDQQIADLVAFLDAMGLQRATFAGHSASGGKVVRLARQFPARVSRIITLDII